MSYVYHPGQGRGFVLVQSVLRPETQENTGNGDAASPVFRLGSFTVTGYNPSS
ncbi:MAG: hypothetical protein JXB03_10105 [Spirochaetales bacterium]|nr:hypothetical protein [Spirochaetales bacterium]